MEWAAYSIAGFWRATLYHSIQSLLCHPPATKLLTCHGYAPGGRRYPHLSTVAGQRAAKIHLRDGTSEAKFTRFRAERDRTPSAPPLMPVAVTYNLTGGLVESHELHTLRGQLAA